METKPAGRIGQYTESSAEAPRTERSLLELCLVLAGTAAHTVNGETQRVFPRSLIWVFPEQTSAFTERTPDFMAWYARFEPELVERACSTPDYQALTQQAPDGSFVRRLSKAGARRLAAHLEALSLPGLDPTHLEAGLHYLLLSSWSEFQKSSEGREVAGLHPAVEKAARILRAEPATGSLNQLAKTCGASPSWLSRLFRQQMSISLVEFRNHCRIERFFELYHDGRHRNIAQTAAEAGFGSYAQFHRVFRKKLGYGPAELRRRSSRAPAPDDPRPAPAPC